MITKSKLVVSWQHTCRILAYHEDYTANCHRRLTSSTISARLCTHRQAWQVAHRAQPGAS